TNNFSNGTLTVSAGLARVAQRATNNATAGISVVPAVSIGGTLDLTNNGLVVDYAPADPSPIGSIRGSLSSAYANGAWTGTGINSSTAAVYNLNPANVNKRALGYAEASSINRTNFFGKTVDGTSVLVAYTISGDANL